MDPPGGLGKYIHSMRPLHLLDLLGGERRVHVRQLVATVRTVALEGVQVALPRVIHSALAVARVELHGLMQLTARAPQDVGELGDLKVPAEGKVSTETEGSVAQRTHQAPLQVLAIRKKAQNEALIPKPRSPAP